MMKQPSLSILVTSLLAACSSGNASPPVEMYIPMGSVQCSGGGKTLTGLKSQLQGAGIQFTSVGCGSDGVMRIALCGAPDGRIAIFSIPSSQSPAATQLGFIPLTKLPNAIRVPCDK